MTRGGHDAAGFGVCDTGVVLDLSLMRQVPFSMARMMAWWAETACVVTGGPCPVDYRLHLLGCRSGTKPIPKAGCRFDDVAWSVPEETALLVVVAAPPPWPHCRALPGPGSSAGQAAGTLVGEFAFDGFWHRQMT